MSKVGPRIVLALAVYVAFCIASTASFSATKPGARKYVKSNAVKKGAVCPKPPPKSSKKPAAKSVAAKTKDAKASAKPKALPRILDLGATKCIPCKMMVPVLAELSKEYKGKLKVEFIDVWENREATGKYKVQTIPTQIFYDAKGKEIHRHVGYFPKDDILKTFKDHGIKLSR